MTRFITSSFSHLILLIGILIMVVPVWMIFASSTHTSSMINMNGLQIFLGDSFYENYLRVLLYQGGFFLVRKSREKSFFHRVYGK